MQKLAAKLTEKLLRRRLISPEQSEWCAYLVECKLEQLLCFSVLITLGCLIAPLWKVLLLNWGVVFLRRKANGLHLHTFLGCMLSSLCCELAALWTCEKATPAVAALLLILILAQKGSAAVKKLWFVPEVLMFIMQIVYISDTFSLLISNFYYFWAVLCTRGLPYSLICIAGLDLTGTWLRDTTIAE